MQSLSQIASRLESTQELVTSNQMVPVLLRKKQTEYVKNIEVANTLLARDYKGAGNEDFVSIIERHE